MKTIYLKITLICLLFQGSLSAQWTQRAGLGQSNKRTFSTSFSVNGKIYVVGGNDNFTGLSDVHEYDPATDTWTSKGAFPGGVRGGAVAFSIGSFGYFMCGSNYVGTFFKDVWQYDPSNDTWTQLGDAPFFIREEAAAFVIGNFGYVGTGYFEIVYPNSTVSATLNDFWQYNPANDSWTQKANVPGPSRAWAIAASANGLGYFGLGGDPGQTTSYNDFYEYDPQLNTWTAKANYPQTLAESTAFNLGSDVYVCGGINFSNMIPTFAFRKYIPSTNTWSIMPSFPGGSIIAATSNTVNNRIFLGTGFNSSLVEREDWWEFVNVSTVTLCPGPISFNTTTVAAGNTTCTGKIFLSGITNACAPYTVSISTNTGSVQTGVNSATITNLCAGDYTVTVTDNNCCGSAQQVCKVVTQNELVGLTENSRETSGLILVPNPNTGQFAIIGYNKSPGTETAGIYITDVLGKQIHFEMNQVDDVLTVSMKDASKGVYFLSYKRGQETITRKFIAN